MNVDDINDPEQLDALIKRSEDHLRSDSSGIPLLDKVASGLEQAGNFAKSVRQGGTEGFGAFKNDMTMFVLDVADALSVVSPETVKDVQTNISKAREARQLRIAQMENPTVARISKEGTRILPHLAPIAAGGKAGAFLVSMLPKSGSLAKVVGTSYGAGFTGGAIADEEDRLAGGATGGLFAVGVDGALRGLRSLVRPERTVHAEKARQAGEKMSRSRATGKDYGYELRKQGEEFYESVGGKQLDEIPLSDKFKQAVVQNKDKYDDAIDKLYVRAARDPKYQHIKFKMDDVQEINKALSDKLKKGNTPPAFNRLVQSFDEFAQTPKNTEAMHNFLKGDEGIEKMIKSIERAEGKGDVYQAAVNAKQALRAKFRDAIDSLEPGKSKILDKANKKYQESLKIFKDNELSASLTNGDFNAILNRLTKPDVGISTKKDLLRFLGPENKQLLDDGLLKAAFNNSISDGVFNGQKFAGYLEKLQRNSKYSLPPRNQKIANNLIELMKKGVQEKYLPTGMEKLGEEAAGRYGGVLRAINDLIDHPMALELLSRAPKDSMKGLAGEAFLNAISRAGARLYNQTEKAPADLTSEINTDDPDALDALIKRSEAFLNSQ